jgi:cathepsin H
MSRLTLTLLLLTSAAAMRFEEFELAFGKKYSSRERFVRRAHFEQSVQRVAAHNANKQHSWRAGINQFSDLSDEEFKSKVLMRPQKCSATNTVGVPGAGDAHGALRGASDNKKKTADLPPSIDWRSRGIVSEVKNQGGCGSCWTFSTTGALEAHLALKAGAWRAPRLSEQQLVDCAGAFDTKGCDGGLPSHAFEYIKHAGGLSTEFSYPYHAKDQKCSFNASASVTAPQSACCVDSSTRHDAIDAMPSTPLRRRRRAGPTASASGCQVAPLTLQRATRWLSSTTWRPEGQ